MNHSYTSSFHSKTSVVQLIIEGNLFTCAFRAVYSLPVPLHKLCPWQCEQRSPSDACASTMDPPTTSSSAIAAEVLTLFSRAVGMLFVGTCIALMYVHPPLSTNSTTSFNKLFFIVSMVGRHNNTTITSGRTTTTNFGSRRWCVCDVPAPNQYASYSVTSSRLSA